MTNIDASTQEASHLTLDDVQDIIAKHRHKTAEKRKTLFIVPSHHPKWAAWMVLRVHVSKGCGYVDQDIVDSIVAEVVIGTRRAGDTLFFGDMPISDDTIAAMYRGADARISDDIEACWMAQTRRMAISMVSQLLQSGIDDVSDVGPHDLAIIHNTDWSVQ